jgi:hypothetical protein
MELIIKSKGENYIVLIDEEDFDRVSEYTWCISHKPYTKYCNANIYNDEKRQTLHLHRFLMGLEKGDKRVINHIDGNGLNNVKSNLEICDKNYNNQSINTKKNFGSICIVNRKKKYYAQVNINKKRYSKHFYTWDQADAWLEGLKQVAIAETLPFNNN